MTPTLISQYADNTDIQISWRSEDLNLLLYPDQTGVSTVKPLVHIARSPKLDTSDQTWFIQATGFKFNNLPNRISEVIAVVKMNRGGRISDDTIQLCYQGQLIGHNQAQMAYDTNLNQNYLTNTTRYGGPTDTWGVKNLTTSMVQDDSFGITLKYKSHPQWPHSTAPILYSVDIQII